MTLASSPISSLLIGAGSWGSRWLHILQEHPEISELAVVDPSPLARDLALGCGAAWFPDLASALGTGLPDLAINASPPAAHTSINRQLIAAGVPILCEKPIAPGLEEAFGVVEEAERAGVPFMVAENLRRGAIPRTARRLLANGEIGSLLALHCSFYRYYDERKPYLVAQTYPLLEDVVVHYVDLAMALAGASPRRVYANAYHPGGGIFDGSPGLALTVTFTNDVVFTFTGQFATRGKVTPWLGEWRAEGSEGSLEFDEGPLRIFSGEESRIVSPAEGSDVLDDFLSLLRGGGPTDTLGRAYLPVQAMIAAAVISCREGRAILIDDNLLLKPDN